jgi:nucleoid DNA-binding protein
VDKAELIAQAATQSGVPETEVARAFEALLEAITDAVRRGEKVSIAGFGNFERRERSAVRRPRAPAPEFVPDRALVRQTVGSAAERAAASEPAPGPEDMRARLADEFTEAVLRVLERDDLPLRDLDEDEIAEMAKHSAGLLLPSLTHARNPVAERIGPTYRVEHLSRYLPGVGADPLTGEAVRKRAKQYQLVGFQSSDRVWLFPEWQFSKAVGRLVPIQAIIDAWKDLPHGGLLADVDLVLWMATRRRDLRNNTPAAWAATQGYDARLRRAVQSVSRRAA